MKLKQINKPTPKCTNCKKYTNWAHNLWNDKRKWLPRRGEGDFGIYECSNCFARYKGEIAT